MNPETYPGSFAFHQRVTADAATGERHAVAVRQYIDIQLARIEQLERDLEAAYRERPVLRPVILGGDPNPCELPVAAAPSFVWSN